MTVGIISLLSISSGEEKSQRTQNTYDIQKDALPRIWQGSRRYLSHAIKYCTGTAVRSRSENPDFWTEAVTAALHYVSGISCNISLVLTPQVTHHQVYTKDLGGNFCWDDEKHGYSLLLFTVEATLNWHPSCSTSICLSWKTCTWEMLSSAGVQDGQLHKPTAFPLLQSPNFPFSKLPRHFCCPFFSSAPPTAPSI